MFEKTTMLVFMQTYALISVCPRSKTEIPHSQCTLTLKKKKIKKVLFRAFQLPDASKPFLMQTQQKHGQLESAELSHSLLLSSLSLSDLLLWLHYTFSFSRCFIQFV